MKKLALLLAATVGFVAPGNTGTSTSAERARWQVQAQNVTITRDDWGIPHIRGKTDADVVFGAMYAQAEDDFNRVEANFITSLGRSAEDEGETAIYNDLRMKLFIDPDSMKKIYSSSPAWLTTLMVAWADGLNFYLAKHPEVKPKVITKFEPWMALSFSEGSIGNDIDGVNVGQLQAFYGNGPVKLSSMTPGSDFDRNARRPIFLKIISIKILEKLKDMALASVTFMSACDVFSVKVNGCDLKPHLEKARWR